MINSGKLAGRTLFITGASRGIGKAIALKAARDGANIVVAAKTAEPHPKLPGTIYTAAKEIEEAGGKALPCIVDVRDESQVRNAVKSAVEKFGGIDILINNASAISLTPTLQTDMKRYDLMHNINTRGTFLVSKECLPYLKQSNHAHILNISPPLNMSKFWFANHVAYTMAKYGMSMCVLGMAEEFKNDNIAVNALWPETSIQTAAMEMLSGDVSQQISRKPEIMSDAAYHVLCQEPNKQTGQFLIDVDVLKAAGITDVKQYACVPENADNLMPDFFLGNGPEDIAKFKDGLITPVTKKDGAAAPKGQVEGLFAKIESLLSEELVQKTNAVFLFNVKGDETGTWFLDLKNGKGQCGRGEGPTKADATLTMDSKNFFDMFSGKLKPAMAFMGGKLQIKGDLQKAMKLEKLMGGLKSKLSKECIPYLKQGKNSHILNISPPLNLAPHWFGPNVAYTMAKYGMSMCVLGMAEEFKESKIDVNALWPRTYISTAAVEMLVGADKMQKYSRKPDIMADAAYHILSQKGVTGNFFIDDDVVQSAGVKDLTQYACVPENADKLIMDGYIDIERK